MSAEDYFFKNIQTLKTTSSDALNFAEQYAKYHTEHHLRKQAEEISEKANYIHTCNNGKGCGIPYCDSLCGNIDKQSIITASENYIKENLL